MIHARKMNVFKRGMMFFLLILGAIPYTSAQVSVSGPTCIIPGLPYQYNIIAQWQTSSTMRLCVTGGTLATGDTCTASGARPSFVIITWRDTTVHILNITSSEGNLSVSMQATHDLSGGTIHDSDKVFVYDSAAASYRFRCALPAGGSCTPVYKYQWQRSENGLNWTDVAGAVQADLVFTAQVRVNTYFRRVTTETASQTIAYSDQALLAVQY